MSEATITFNGVQYTVNWDDDRTGNPDEVEYCVYRADTQECLGSVMRGFYTTSSYYAGYTYYKRGATKDWDFDPWPNTDTSAMAQVALFDALMRQPADAFKTYRSAVKHFLSVVQGHPCGMDTKGASE